jgi:hypothetical protein
VNVPEAPQPTLKIRLVFRNSIDPGYFYYIVLSAQEEIFPEVSGANRGSGWEKYLLYTSAYGTGNGVFYWKDLTLENSSPDDPPDFLSFSDVALSFRICSTPVNGMMVSNNTLEVSFNLDKLGYDGEIQLNFLVATRWLDRTSNPDDSGEVVETLSNEPYGLRVTLANGVKLTESMVVADVDDEEWLPPSCDLVDWSVEVSGL